MIMSELVSMNIEALSVCYSNSNYSQGIFLECGHVFSILA